VRIIFLIGLNSLSSLIPLIISFRINRFPEKLLAAVPKPSTRKRAREELYETNSPTPSDLFLPPSKKHRGDASASTTIQVAVASKTGKLPVAAPALPKDQASKVPFFSLPQHACQRSGRVFAPWRKVYYTATVTDSWQDEGVTVCKVHFDDNTWVDIPLKSLYRCRFQEGDKVKVPGARGKKLGRDGYVSAVPLWEDQRMVSVCLETALQEEVVIFEGKEVAVEADSVTEEWEDRKVVTLEDIGLGQVSIWVQGEKKRTETEAKVTAQASSPPQLKGGPPSRPTGSSLPSRRRKRPPPAIDDEDPGSPHKRRRLEEPSTSNPSPSKPFTNHTFILSIPVNDNEGNRLDIRQRAMKKLNLTLDIEDLGGNVVSTFGDLVQWGGVISENHDRWVWNAGDIKQVRGEPSGPTTEGNRGTGSFDPSEPSKIFLVAEGASLSTKYLLALAAGIPCIDQGWLHSGVSRKYITLTPLTYSSGRLTFHGMRTSFQQANLLAWAAPVLSGWTNCIQSILGH
jgi:DNA repair protein Crb2 Tudor domain